MSRRGFQTVNLPRDVVQWIDRIVQREAYAADTLSIPLGVKSRDEFVRLAVALLLMATTRSDSAPPPLDVLRDLVDRLQRED